MRNRFHRAQPGQSIVLLAFMVLVLIAMIGLSVDVGNAFAQQRRLQSVANAGALAAQASLLTNSTNNGVWTDAQRALQGNRISPNPSYTYTVHYVKSDDTLQTLGEWNGSTSYVPNGASAPPTNVVRLQVTVAERVATYFAGVVGTRSLTVSANGVSCLGDYSYGVYPMAIPITIRPPVTDSHGNVTTPGDTVFLSDGTTQLSPSDARYGKWGSAMQGMTVRFPVANGSDFISGVHVSWLNWGGQTQTVNGVTYTQLPGKNGDSSLAAAWTYPGTIQQGFLEAASQDASKPNIQPIGRLQRGDWISGDPGVKAALQAQLDTLRTNQTDVMLPFYDVNNGSNGSNAAYHTVNVGHFIIRNFSLTSGSKYIDLKYVGDAVTAPQSCGSEAKPDWKTPNGTPIIPAASKQFGIDGLANVTRAWRTWTSSQSTSYDIVIVMDTSLSMQWDWFDRQPGQSGYSAANARIIDAKQAVASFVQSYDVSTATGDPDARISFVTFGGTTAGSYDPATCYTSGCYTPQGFSPSVIQANWTTACSAANLANNCNGVANKWPTIQSKANSMTPAGITPGPIGFETVATLLQNKRTPPNGKKYGQIVIFATDGVFNVCGTDHGDNSCPYGQMVPFDGSSSDPLFYLNNAGYNAVSGRPIWQAEQVAARIRNSGARIFVVAETPTCLQGSTTCFPPNGLMNMSSGSGYYYTAQDSNAMANIYATIRDRISNDICQPHETTQLAANANITLTQPNNPTFSMQTTANGSGAYSFNNLPGGQYLVKVNPSLSLLSPEDGYTRTYSRLRNSRSLSEEGQASVYLDPQYPNGAREYSEVILSLPLANDGTPNNGCTMPAP
ncbi:MAG: hypothetical protein H0X37_08920 [Herpetosiphonaceae bacterium]|nr:hypothetical protein [Herpetosiphonaceae bacterium]